MTSPNNLPMRPVRIIHRWSDHDAGYIYEFLRVRRSARDPKVWHWQSVATGDLNWAQRQAEHYAVPIEEAGDDY